MEQNDIIKIHKKLDDIMDATDQIAKLADKIDKCERVLRGGNGDGLGLLARVVNLEKIAEANSAILFGDDEKPGLKGSVQELINTVNSYNKLMWVVLTAALGTI